MTCRESTSGIKIWLARTSLRRICPATNLQNAQFRDAVVVGASFANTNLTQQQLLSVSGTFQSIDLSGNNLEGWLFSGKELLNAKLSATNLTNANFSSAKLTAADFTGAAIAGASFAKTTGPSGFIKEQLYSTASYQQLRTTIHIAKRQRSVRMGFQWSGHQWLRLQQRKRIGADFAGAVINGATLAHTGLAKEQLYSSASFQQRDLRGISLQSNDLSGWDFSGQNLGGANLRGALRW